MKIVILVLLLIGSLNAEDFITKMEYAKKLYSNPRGIGCISCHGPRGERSVIARYKHRGEKRELVAPAINSLTLEEFFRGLRGSDSVMPKYFLTDSEIEALYYFVTSEVDNEYKKQ